MKNQKRKIKIDDFTYEVHGEVIGIVIESKEKYSFIFKPLTKFYAFLQQSK